MAVNIYVVLPRGHPGASARDYFTGAASGLAWVILNYGHPFSSMIMAGLWALALACYLTGMFLAARPAR